MKKQELLAPAGDIEAGYAALYYGADAVYLGLPRFSARATATNFNETELDEFTAYAHSLNRKVYVALNTVLQESELPELLKSLDICTRCRVDGLIIQDLGVARVMREKYPWFEMHASTQMAVHNKEGALFLQKLGFKRVVLARELTLAEIKEIAALDGLETEAFIHGALCYSYSGLCQFSALEYGRSANRGKCLYPCRACFKRDDGRDAHFFSMKDMALQEDILKLPVDSLKIEGRKKSALYVAAVTDYYRRILDGKGADEQRAEKIKQIFSRPWCKFHFNGRNKSVTDRDFVGHRGLPVGTVSNVQHGWLTFKTTHKIARHDGLQIDVSGEEKPFGFAVQKMSVNRKSCFEAKAGETVSVELPKNYPAQLKGNTVCLASSSEVKGAYPYVKPKPKEFRNTREIDVKVKVEQKRVTAVCNVYGAEVTGDFAPAKDAEKSAEAIRQAFAKTGDTNFKLRKLDIENKENLFTPVSLLNELRRKLYEQIKPEEKHTELPPVVSRTDTAPRQPRFIVKTDNLNCLKLLNIKEIEEIVYVLAPQSSLTGLAELPKNKVRLALPAVCRNPALYAEIIRRLLDGGYRKWQVANYWAPEILPVKQLDISFDSSLYMLNTQAIALAAEIGADRVTLSLEDTKTNICDLIVKSPLKTELVIYGDIPLFTSAACIRDNDCSVCNRKDLFYTLNKDGHRYTAFSHNCQTMVFDAQPYCLASEAADLKPDYFRADFCYLPYTAEKVAEVFAKLREFSDLVPCIKGNFHNANI